MFNLVSNFSGSHQVGASTFFCTHGRRTPRVPLAVPEGYDVEMLLNPDWSLGHFVALS